MLDLQDGLPISLTLQTDLSDAVSYSKYSHIGVYPAFAPPTFELNSQGPGSHDANGALAHPTFGPIPLAHPTSEQFPGLC
jgi:hypothetical protein